GVFCRADDFRIRISSFVHSRRLESFFAINDSYLQAAPLNRCAKRMQYMTARCLVDAGSTRTSTIIFGLVSLTLAAQRETQVAGARPSFTSAIRRTIRPQRAISWAGRAVSRALVARWCSHCNHGRSRGTIFFNQEIFQNDD